MHWVNHGIQNILYAWFAKNLSQIPHSMNAKGNQFVPPALHKNIVKNVIIAKSQ